jgi:hypothetical protein
MNCTFSLLNASSGKFLNAIFLRPEKDLDAVVQKSIGFLRPLVNSIMPLRVAAPRHCSLGLLFLQTGSASGAENA